MKKKREPPEDAAGLRCRAETKLSGRKKKAASFPATETDAWRLVHELEVHQIELEMQNEELMQARAETEALLHQYTDLYEFAPVGYFTLARDCTIHQVNLAGATLLGVERGKLIKQRFGVFVSARSRTTFNTFIEEVFGSRQKETCEIELRKDGSAPLWVRIEAVTEDGQECRFVVLDITKRKQAVETLRETNEYLENLFNYANSPIIVWDTSFIITRFNYAFEQLTGYNAEEVRGKKVDILFSKEKMDSGLDLLKRTVSGDRWEGVEIEIKRKDEETRIVLWSSANICDKDGKTVIATIAQGHDITERKQAVEEIRCQKNELVELNKSLESANDRLKDLDQIKSDFLSTVSHEIRTPIAIIHEAVSLCLDGDGGKLQEKHSRYLNMAQNNIDRLTRLVTDLLDISKIEQNKLKLRKSSMDLWNTAQKIHNEYRPRAESKGIRLELDRQFSGDTLRFYGDEDKIIQILNNLLGNAIRCSALGGQITIRLIDEKDFVRFAISDTGIGISKENASKLFDKFQQIGRVDGPGYKGTGLGLAISKGLVEKHGGKIWIESELGQGSTFYFTLKKELFPKILIVDDSKELIELVQQMLAETEYRYTEAYDGEQAVQIAQNDRFDLILLDMQLPKMSGYEVIGRLKQDKRTHDIPILIMSAFSVDRDHVNQISDETAIPVIKKPFVIDEIKETVEELLIN
jgi:PAS domain S-box-containing protein